MKVLFDSMKPAEQSPFEDEEPVHIAGMLNAFLLLIIAFGILAAIIITVANPEQLSRALSEGFLPFFLAVIARIALKREQVKVAAWLLVLAIWLLALLVTMAGGVDRADIVIFDLPVLLGFLLLGRRSGILILTVTTLTSAALLWIDANTILLPEASMEDLGATWLFQLLILVIVAWLYNFATGRIKQNLERVQRQEYLLAARNQELLQQIAEREQVEDAYQTLVENSLQGLVVLQEGRNVFANQAFADITGYTIPQLLAFENAIDVVIHPDDQAFVHARAAARLTGENVPQQYELRILRQDGVVRWCELFSAAIIYRGKPAIQVTFMDLTDRKQAQDELQRSAELMRAVVDSVTNGIMVTDLDSNIIIYNQRYLELFDLPGSYTTASFQDRNALFQTRLKDPRWLARRLAQIEHDSTFAGESVIETIDGRFMQTYSQPYVVGGEVVGRVFIYFDISDQRRAQEELERSVTLTRAVIDSATNGIFVLGLDNDIIIYNQHYLNMFNLPPEYVKESFQRRKAMFQAQLRDPGWLDRQLNKLSKDPDLLAEDTFELKDGRVLDVYMQPYIVEGERIGRVYRYLDVTDRKQAAEKQLELAVEKEKVDLLRQFIGNVSHDLKTPLAIIKTSLYLLEKTDDPARKAEKLDVIGLQTDRLESLIQDLLTISRLDYVSHLDFEPVHLDQLLREVMQAFNPRLESKRQGFSIRVDDEMPLVMGNTGELNRALGNLVENAINYTPEGGQIHCFLSCDADLVRLAITDTGIGIDPADLPYVFNRFYRSDEARTVLSTGSGLGLAIVKKVVELHAGNIVVESQPGAGTTFRISLPALLEPVGA